MAYVIIGASSGLGVALARRFAHAGHDLVLVARRQQALNELADELMRMYGVGVACVAADVTAGPAYLDAVIAETEDRDGVEGVLFAVGLSARDTVAGGEADIQSLVATNFTAIAEAVTRLWPLLSQGPGATLVALGSITAIRGRGRNLVYGAAKRALAAYFEGLRIAAHGTPITVRFYLCGFLTTEATAREPTLLPRGDAGKLADLVYRDLGHKGGVRYFPAFWRPIAWLLRVLPWPIYRRLAG